MLILSDLLELRTSKLRCIFALINSTYLPNFVILFVNASSGRAIHVPQISTWIYGGIPGDHPCENFLMVSLRK